MIERDDFIWMKIGDEFEVYVNLYIWQDLTIAANSANIASSWCRKAERRRLACTAPEH
jgi:hypothetical protein